MGSTWSTLDLLGCLGKSAHVRGVRLVTQPTPCAKSLQDFDTMVVWSLSFKYQQTSSPSQCGIMGFTQKCILLKFLRPSVQQHDPWQLSLFGTSTNAFRLHAIGNEDWHFILFVLFLNLPNSSIHILCREMNLTCSREDWQRAWIWHLHLPIGFSLKVKSLLILQYPPTTQRTIIAEDVELGLRNYFFNFIHILLTLHAGTTPATCICTIVVDCTMPRRRFEPMFAFCLEGFY